MTALIVPQDTARGFRLDDIPLANGQSVTFAVGAYSANYTVTDGSVNIIVTAGAAIIANDGAVWTLKQSSTTYKTGNLYITPTDSDGDAGPTGPPGADGTDGVDGSKWYSGAGVPSNGANVVGDWYVNTTNSDVYEKTGASAWTLRTNIKGATGSTGTAGTNGSAGSAGADGAGLGLKYVRTGYFMYFPTNAGPTATGTATAGNIYYTPVFVDKTGGIAIDQVIYEVTVLAASTVVKVGLYTANTSTGMPDTLIGQASNTGDATTVAQKSITWSTTLPKGLSWLAIVVQGGSPTLRSVTGRSPFVHSTVVSNAINTSGYLTGASLTTGDFPSTAVAPTAHGSVMNVGVRYA